MSQLSELARHLTAPDERELVSHLEWFITLPDAARAKLLADLEPLESEEDPKLLKAKLAEILIAGLERLDTNPWSEAGLLEETARQFINRFPRPLIQAVWSDPELRRRLAQKVDQGIFERLMEELSKRAGCILDVCRCGRFLAEASDERAGLVDPQGAPIGPSAEEAAKKALHALEELRLVYAATEPAEKGRELLAEICYRIHELRKRDAPGQSRRQIEGIGMGGLTEPDLAHDMFLAYEEKRGDVREQYVLSGNPAGVPRYLMRVMMNAGIDAYREQQQQAGVIPSHGQAATEQDEQEWPKAAGSIRILRLDGTVDPERTEAEKARWLEKKRSEGDERPEGVGTGRWERSEPPCPIPTNSERGHEIDEGYSLDETLSPAVKDEQRREDSRRRLIIWERVILRLKPARREREILRLWLVEDLSDVEIGRKVKRSRETVNRVRNEWIRRIRKFLDKNPRLCDLLKGRKTLQ